MIEVGGGGGHFDHFLSQFFEMQMPPKSTSSKRIIIEQAKENYSIILCVLFFFFFRRVLVYDLRYQDVWNNNYNKNESYMHIVCVQFLIISSLFFDYYLHHLNVLWQQRQHTPHPRQSCGKGKE